MIALEALADVQAHHDAELRHRLEERVPVVEVVVAREAHEVRQLGHRDRAAALRRDPTHLGDHGRRVPHRCDSERDEPSGIRRRPLVDVPVVVGTDDNRREVLVGCVLQRAPVEPDERREAHRCEHAIDVHVADAVVDVVGAGAHLREGHRIETPVLLRPPDHRVQCDRAGDVALELPLLHAGFGDDDPRGLVGVLRRHVTLEHVGGLDHMVVDADQDHVLKLQGGSPDLSIL